MIVDSTDVMGPDEHGIKTVIEHGHDETTGRKFITTRRIKVTKVIERVSKAVLARRQWKQFGQFEKQSSTLSHDSVRVEKDPEKVVVLPSAEKYVAKKPTVASVEKYTPSSSAEKYKPPIEKFTLAEKYKPPTEKYKPPTEKYKPPTSVEKYKVPEPEKKEHTLFFGNLAEYTTDLDLIVLLRSIRIYHSRLSMPKLDGSCRGFAFVSVHNIEDGEEVIAKLNGCAFHNLILNIGWSNARSTKY